MMEITLHFVPAVVGAIVGLFVADAWADWHSGKVVYGRMLKHDELVHYFNENWKKYDRLVSDSILTHGEAPLESPYIASHYRKSRFSKWHIQGIGQIPLKSPYSKLLDKKFEELKTQQDV